MADKFIRRAKMLLGADEGCSDRVTQLARELQANAERLTRAHTVLLALCDRYEAETASAPRANPWLADPEVREARSLLQDIQEVLNE